MYPLEVHEPSFTHELMTKKELLVDTSRDDVVDATGKMLPSYSNHNDDQCSDSSGFPLSIDQGSLQSKPESLQSEYRGILNLKNYPRA